MAHPAANNPQIWAENNPLIQKVAHEFERAGYGEWNNNRLSKLCRDMGKTVWLVCAEAGAFKPVYDPVHDLIRLKLDLGLIRRCWAKNTWPVCLTTHFDRFERFVRMSAEGAPRETLLTPIDILHAQFLTPAQKTYG